MRALLLVLLLVPVAHGAVIRYDDGTMETNIPLDYTDDWAEKRIDISPGTQKTSPKLWVYGAGFGTRVNRDSFFIKVNGDNNKRLYFNPVDKFGTTWNWQSFDIPAQWLVNGRNTFYFFDYTGVWPCNPCDWEVNNLFIGIDNSASGHSDGCFNWGNCVARNAELMVYLDTAPDTTAPARSNGAPNGVITTSTATLSLSTDETATCRYATVAGTSYDAMTSATTAAGTSHSWQLSGLVNGARTYYVRCSDAAGNKNTDDYAISFTVNVPAPTTTTTTSIPWTTTTTSIPWTTTTTSIPWTTTTTSTTTTRPTITTVPPMTTTTTTSTTTTTQPSDQRVQFELILKKQLSYDIEMPFKVYDLTGTTQISSGSAQFNAGETRKTASFSAPPSVQQFLIHMTSPLVGGKKEFVLTDSVGITTSTTSTIPISSPTSTTTTVPTTTTTTVPTTTTTTVPGTDFYGQQLTVLKLFGQSDIKETARGKVTANAIYHAAGVLVDRSSTPNKIYVTDSGNSRILGFNGMGWCSNGRSRSCTIDADCPGSSCFIDGTKPADIVFGQKDFSTSSCNRDNNKGITIPAAADTLCLMGYPAQTNIAEEWMRINSDVDREGNLYVPDRFNNRVLKYNAPFSSDKSHGKGDSIADFVWGQDDFSSNGINKGPSTYYAVSTGTPSDSSLWLSFGPPDHVASRGVSVDSSGNVWVADTFNSRVLRFPSGSKRADLVLGQTTFSSSGYSCGINYAPLNSMCRPTLARLDPASGKLYVLDEHTPEFKARILVFDPPFTNGMAAAKVIIPQLPVHLYVADTGNNRVQKFKLTGSFVTKWGTLGSGDGQFNAPRGIAAYTENVYVADTNNHRIQKFTENGAFLMKWGSQGTADGQFRNPQGVAVDSEGNVYVADTGNHRVQKFTSAGVFITKWGTEGSGEGQFRAPTDIAVIRTNVYVADSGNNRIQKFSTGGQYVSTLWTRPGGAPMQFGTPLGIGTGFVTMLFVADTHNNVIYSFRPLASFMVLISTIADIISDDGEIIGSMFNAPADIVSDALGTMYVADTGNNRVQKLHPSGESVGQWGTLGSGDGQFNAPASIAATVASSYYFTATGFIFNTFTQGEYAAGKLWINEHAFRRTILVDESGAFVKVIGSLSPYRGGGDQQYPSGCGSIYESGRFRIWWPGGSIGMDSANNLYFADEVFHRIARFALPYNFVQRGGATCLPDPNGGLFPTGPNTPADEALGEAVGLAVFGDQLIVQSGGDLKVWNTYLQKSIGATPDFIIDKDIAGLPARNLLSAAIDDSNRLWLFNEHTRIRVYQLPFTQNNQPHIRDWVPLYWSDTDTEVSYDGWTDRAIAFDKINKKLYIVDKHRHRILRVSNYNDIAVEGARLKVDMVIGQPDKDTIKCNHNQEMPWTAAGSPTADSLCSPSQIKFDPQGNLYVIEGTYECHGNDRIVVYMADDLRNAAGMFPNLQAKKVFVAPNLNSKGSCTAYDGPRQPVSMAFNSKGELVVGNDGYYPGHSGRHPERHIKQLWLYRDPLNDQTADAYLRVPIGAPGEIEFDAQDNLIIQDHTWSRAWVINPDHDPFWVVPV